MTSPLDTRPSLQELFVVTDPKKEEASRPELGWTRTSKLLPDPEVVSALVQAVFAESYSPSDKRIRHQRLSPSTLEGNLHREPDRFRLPERILKESADSFYTTRFLSRFADHVLREAQSKITPKQLAAARETYPSVMNPRWGYGVGFDQENLYVDISTSTGQTSREVGTDFQGFTDHVRELLRAAVTEVLSDAAFVETVRGNIEVLESIDILVVLRDEIARLKAQADEVETPDQKNQFMTYLQQSVAVLGCPELQVEILDPKDSLLLNCKGLYRSNGTDGRPTIYVALSQHGTNHLYEMEEWNEIIAHEVAHYQLDRNTKVPVSTEMPKEPENSPARTAMRKRLNRRKLSAVVYPRTEVDSEGNAVITGKNKHQIALEGANTSDGLHACCKTVASFFNCAEVNIQIIDDGSCGFKAPTTIEVPKDLSKWGIETIFIDALSDYMVAAGKPFPEELEDRAHNFTHSTVTSENLRRLRSCRMLKAGGDMHLMAPFDMDTTTPIIRQMSTFAHENAARGSTRWVELTPETDPLSLKDRGAIWKLSQGTAWYTLAKEV